MALLVQCKSKSEYPFPGQCIALSLRFQDKEDWICGFNSSLTRRARCRKTKAIASYSKSSAARAPILHQVQSFRYNHWGWIEKTWLDQIYLENQPSVLRRTLVAEYSAISRVLPTASSHMGYLLSSRLWPEPAMLLIHLPSMPRRRRSTWRT